MKTLKRIVGVVVFGVGFGLLVLSAGAPPVAAAIVALSITCIIGGTLVLLAV